MEKSKVIKTLVSVIYESTDITQEINADLLSFSYEDNCSDECDSVSITLKDEQGKWAGSWSPDRGAKVRCMLSTNQGQSLETGLMIINSLSAQGAPRTFDMQAISVPLENTVRKTAKTRNFENLDLKTIANSIATDNKLKLFFDSQENPTYDRIDQKDETDLKFLERICKEAGLSLKVNSEQLIMFDQKSYEKKDPIATYALGLSPVLRWSFNAQQAERYRACRIKWRDFKKKGKDTSTATVAFRSAQEAQSQNGKVDLSWEHKPQEVKKGNTALKAEYIDYTYTDETVDPSGQVYVLKKRCTSLAEAQRLANAKLRELNQRQTTGSLTLVGNPLLYAGAVVALSGFGSFDGNFIIEKATHSVSNSGYVTDIEVRRVNNEY